MARIEWQADYATGVAVVDDQHRHLVDIINKFEDALQKGKGSRQMNEILKDLIGYTQEHFAAEEALMAEAGYEGLKLHQSQHRQLMQKIERFQFDFNGAGKRVTTEVHEFLSYWLVTHILHDDMLYAPCLKGETATVTQE